MYVTGRKKKKKKTSLFSGTGPKNHLSFVMFNVTYTRYLQLIKHAARISTAAQQLQQQSYC